MEYQVPQFIEVESKIVGPLTLRQFIYLAGSIGLCVIFFFYLPLVFALLLGVPIGGLGVALAFYKVNGKPFIEVLEAGFNYYTSSKLFLWKRHEQKTEQMPQTMRAAAPQASGATPRLTNGKLSELAWSLDVQNHERQVGSAPAEPLK